MVLKVGRERLDLLLLYLVHDLHDLVELLLLLLQVLVDEHDVLLVGLLQAVHVADLLRELAEGGRDAGDYRVGGGRLRLLLLLLRLLMAAQARVGAGRRGRGHEANHR